MHKTQEKHFLWSIIIFLSLKPIYLLPSGSIQICDIFFMLCILWSIFELKGKLYLKYKNVKLVFFFLSLVFYQCIVNVMWYTIDFDSSFLLNSLFYIYNFLAFLFFINIGEKTSINSFRKSIAYGSFLSSCVALTGIFFNTGNGRGVGFFNNPNQLGFHGILIFTLIFFTKDYLPKVLKWLTLIVSIILVLASASKAAFIGVTCLSIVYILFSEKEINIKNIVIKMFLLVVVAILLFIFFFVQNPVTTDNNILATMQYRLLNMMDNPTSNLATGRGYARILEMGVHFLWGMGEGNFGRFMTLSYLEVHNLFINLFVSYGLIGFIGYMFIFGYIFIQRDSLKASLYNILGFSGIFIYSFTHNSIRNTIIFLLLALLLLQKMNKDFNIGEKNDKRQTSL